MQFQGSDYSCTCSCNSTWITYLNDMEYMTCFKHCFVHLSTVKNVLGLLGENIIMNKQTHCPFTSFLHTWNIHYIYCTTPPLIVIFVKLSRTGMHYQEKLLTLSPLINSKKSYLSNSVKGKKPWEWPCDEHKYCTIINSMNIFIHFVFCRRFCYNYHF